MEIFEIAALLGKTLKENEKLVRLENAKKAYKDNISLKEACVALGFLTAERFDEVFHPEQMV